MNHDSGNQKQYAASRKNHVSMIFAYLGISLCTCGVV
jgi:hypothetical protein